MVAHAGNSAPLVIFVSYFSDSHLCYLEAKCGIVNNAVDPYSALSLCGDYLEPSFLYHRGSADDDGQSSSIASLTAISYLP